MCKKNSTFVGEINRLLLIENNNGQLGETILIQKNIKRDIVNNNLNNIFQQLLRAKQHIARSRSILSDNIDNIDDNDNNYSFIQKYASLQKYLKCYLSPCPSGRNLINLLTLPTSLRGRRTWFSEINCLTLSLATLARLIL
jgi:hypothetical protein